MTRPRRAPDAVFAALADPTRLAVFEAVATSGPTTATELAADLPITRQAVSKHLAVLRDAGLVLGARAGRETRYEAGGDGLDAAGAWIDDVGAAWDRRLARLQRRVKGSRPG